MSSGNRLSATVPERHREEINNLGDERGLDDADAERAVVEAGLEQLGYLDADNPGDSYLSRVRKTGATLGAAGITLIAWGIFATQIFLYIGFGLVLAGFALIAGAEFAPEISDWLDTRRSGGEVA